MRHESGGMHKWLMKQRVADGTDLVRLLGMRPAKRMSHRKLKLAAAAFYACCLIDVSFLSYAGATDGTPVVLNAPKTGSTVHLDTSVQKFQGLDPTVSVPVESSASSNVAREIPSITGNLSIQGTTLKPYIGAGFNRGFASDLDRSLSGGFPSLASPSLGSLLGEGLVPTEFQLGIRIPF